MSNAVKNWLNRRNLLTAAGLAAITGMSHANTAEKKPCRTRAQRRAHHQAVETAIAKQQIAELRCEYAKATDLIGTAQASAVSEGRAIYHRIFHKDARIAATGVDTVTGPDAWVDIVLEALTPYEKTQHLIGSQIVSIDALPGASERPGKAQMSSYLQAWHAKADGELWLFLGTYADQLVHSQEHGWQITSMDLVQVSGETRQLNS